MGSQAGAVGPGMQKEQEVPGSRSAHEWSWRNICGGLTYTRRSWQGPTHLLQEKHQEKPDTFPARALAPALAPGPAAPNSLNNVLL